MPDDPTKWSYTPEQVANAIFGQESNYGKNARTSATGAVGPMQIMPGTWKQWAKPGEDINNPADNRAVGLRMISSYMSRYGGDPARVAAAYFSGPGNVAPPGSAQPFLRNASDPNKSTSSYVNDILTRLRSPSGQFPSAGPARPVTPTPGTTLNTSGGPGVAAGGPPAVPATGQPGQQSGGLAGSLPGFTPNSPGAKMTAAGLQQLAGGGSAGGGGDQPPAMPSMQLPPPMAAGGPMMLGPGGQNMYPRAVAQQNLAQQGFPIAPSLAAYAGGGAPSPAPVMAPGAAIGMPSMPGTTLNSPSQLQMALMTGALSPYDLYARSA